jgi:predicted DNA-binding transcriptional regulator AlpA
MCSEEQRMTNSESGGHSVSQTPSNGKASSKATRQSPIRSANAALLNDDQAAREVLGVSPRTFAKLMGEPWMPAPIQLGPRLRRWSRAELEAALVNAPRQAGQGGEPAQLRRAKIDAMKARGVGC